MSDYPTLDWMMRNKVPVTREKYIALNWGSDAGDWNIGKELELPPKLQRLDLFEVIGDEIVYKGKADAA